MGAGVDGAFDVDVEAAGAALGFVDISLRSAIQKDSGVYL
jgi:hypothetical protein